MINGREKGKTESLIAKIEQGEFDEDDIDLIFIRLRDYSDINSVFREIGHFIAHSKKRDRGITYDALWVFHTMIQYMFDYKMKRKKFDIFQLFPIYIKDLILYQITRIGEAKLKNKYNLNYNLKKIVNTLIIEAQQNKCILNPIDLRFGTYTVEEQTSICDLIYDLMGFIQRPTMYNQADIIDSIVDTIKINNLLINENVFKQQGDKIMLCILCMLHNKEFSLKNYPIANCKIGSSKNVYRHFDNDPKLGKIFVEDTLGYNIITLDGNVEVEYKTGFTVRGKFPFITTDLNASDWCKLEIFDCEIPDSETIEHPFREKTYLYPIESTLNLKVNDNYKIVEA